MESKKLFDKYYSRVAHEGMLNAAVIGAIAGCSVTILVGLITLFFSGFKFWFLIALGAGLVVFAITTIVLYYVKYRPDTKMIAERIDKLGLEERLITMTELENDDSYIAMRQREDAKEKLNTVNRKNIKFFVARSLIITVAVLGAVGLVMTSLNALSGFGIIDWGKVFPKRLTDDDYVTIRYLVDGDGSIEGETLQEKIVRGGKGETVIAVANQGWAFVGWSDNFRLPERTDNNVMQNMTVTAIFSEVDTVKADDVDDAPADVPNDAKSDDNVDMNDNDTNKEKEDEYDISQQIIDGATPYQHEFDDYYEQVIEELSKNGNLTEQQKAMIQAYFKSLEAGVSDSDRQQEGNSGNNQGGSGGLLRP